MVIGKLRHCSRTAVSMHSRLRSVALSKNIGVQYTNPVRDKHLDEGKAPGGARQTSNFIDFGGQHEIALGQTIDLMRPNLDLRRPPSKADIRMMPLLFR